MLQRKANIPPQHERWIPRHGQRYFLILGHGTIQSFRWQSTELDPQAWSFGNCFRLRREAAQARDQLKAVLLTFHQQHTSPRMATSLIHTLGACSTLSLLLASPDGPPSCFSLRKMFLPAERRSALRTAQVYFPVPRM